VGNRAVGQHWGLLLNTDTQLLEFEPLLLHVGSDALSGASKNTRFNFEGTCAGTMQAERAVCSEPQASNACALPHFRSTTVTQDTDFRSTYLLKLHPVFLPRLYRTTRPTCYQRTIQRHSVCQSCG
jgi:hypothetical protein